MTLRDRLRSRALPTAEVTLPADPVTFAAAQRQVEIDTRTLQTAQVQGLDLQVYRDRLTASQDHLDSLPVEVIRMRCLPVADWEALIDEHPPSDEQRTQGWQWDVTRFRPALLAACVVPDEGEDSLGERGWVEVAEEGQMTAGELDTLFAAAVQLHARPPQVSTGKDF